MLQIEISFVFEALLSLKSFFSISRYSGALRSSGANAPSQYITAGMWHRVNAAVKTRRVSHRLW